MLIPGQNFENVLAGMVAFALSTTMLCLEFALNKYLKVPHKMLL